MREENNIYARNLPQTDVDEGGGRFERRPCETHLFKIIQLDRENNQQDARYGNGTTQFYRSARYLRLRNVRGELLRTILHQLRERKTAAAVQHACL